MTRTNALVGPVIAPAMINGSCNVVVGLKRNFQEMLCLVAHLKQRDFAPLGQIGGERAYEFSALLCVHKWRATAYASFGHSCILAVHPIPLILKVLDALPIANKRVTKKQAP
jgi:hypothetical protein